MDTPKRPRILTFDLMRGYFLVAIILDHLRFFPSGLEFWSAQGDLFTTTAEGFFLISGLVLGIVRGSKLLAKPFSVVTRLLINRGVQLYITAISLVLIFTLIGWLLIDNPGLKVGIILPTTNLLDVLWKTITLQYFYGWADYLRLYAIFLLVSPLAMWLLRRGWWYILLGANFAVWLLFPSDPTVPDITQELLQPLTWQLIFFGGITIGFYWNQITAWWLSLTLRMRSIVTWSVVGLAVITLVINVLIVFAPDYLHSIGYPVDLHYTLYRGYFDKERLPLTRIGLFLLWFWAAFALFQRFEPFILRILGWLLLPFGTNSLYVYTVHAFVIFFIQLYLKPSNWLVNLVVSLSAILLIRIMIHYKVLMKIIPR
ncbi:MAG: hypothetical protein JWP06_880 [Candidatus Saccharibacteria bacterium]|nr:hypothetical protein [Candidatus Saccharibacteria bacterium]